MPQSFRKRFRCFDAVSAGSASLLTNSGPLTASRYVWQHASRDRCTRRFDSLRLLVTDYDVAHAAFFQLSPSISNASLSRIYVDASSRNNKTSASSSLSRCADILNRIARRVAGGSPCRRLRHDASEGIEPQSTFPNGEIDGGDEPSDPLRMLALLARPMSLEVLRRACDHHPASRPSIVYYRTAI